MMSIAEIVQLVRFNVAIKKNILQTWRQFLSDGCQVFRFSYSGDGSSAAILRRTEKEIRSVWLVTVEVIVNFVADRYLSMSETLKDFLVRLCHLRFNVVKEKCEMFCNDESNF